MQFYLFVYDEDKKFPKLTIIKTKYFILKVIFLIKKYKVIYENRIYKY